MNIKTLSFVALVSAGLGVVLMAVRTYYAVSFSEPLQLTTSGAEYESLYVIWKYIQGAPVYVDQTRIPFAGTYYNWLYYAFYGEVASFVLSALSLTDAWLPTITKLLTLSGATIGTWVSYRCFWNMGFGQDKNGRLLSFAFAVLLFFGPLMGFWAIATAPDIWALTLDVTAVFVFLRYYQSHPVKAVLLFCLFAYLAWSFKQIFVFSPGAVGLLLLIRRDWKLLFILTFGMWSAWGLTLAIGSLDYVHTIVAFGGTSVELARYELVRNLINLTVKIQPVLIMLAVAVIATVINPSFRTVLRVGFSEGENRGPEITFSLALLGVLITSVLAIPASAKIGASENYYFTLTFFMMLAGLSWLRISSQKENIVGWAYGAMSLGWLGNLIAVSSVFVGLQGVLSTRHMHDSMTAAAGCLNQQSLSDSLFISNPYLSLPWMVPARQHFVIHYNYPMDRASGVSMEGGGVGGLIDDGYFATLILPAGLKGSYDGAQLSRYRLRPQTCPGLLIYDRTNVPAPPPDQTSGGSAPKS
ncbi:MAG: hypothetical protein HQ494_09075 [Rhodospirillales bacterium]|nr:hypothetical protein [Rhodospirillales bacterium]